MRRFLWVCLWVCLAAAQPAFAQGVEPERGSALRADLLDAVRVVAEHQLDAPVEFVVTLLAVDGDAAFAQLQAQRPGGGAIDMSQTPLVRFEGLPAHAIDGARIEAFLRAGADGDWQVVTHAIGATDVWWWGYRCDIFASVLPDEAC